MNNKNDVIKQMQEIIDTSAANPDVTIEYIKENDSVDFQWIPELKEDEFILPAFDYENSKIIACVKELDWYVSQEIKVIAYRKSKATENKVYFSGECERRETLSRAIIWIADTTSQQVMFNRNGQILSRISLDIVDMLWERYYPIIKVSASEANAIYNAALMYFQGIDTDLPIPPIVIEVDAIQKMGRLTRDEIKNIKASDMEKIKLVWKARSEVLFANQTEEDSSDNLDISGYSFPPNFKGFNTTS